MCVAFCAATQKQTAEERQAGKCKQTKHAAWLDYYWRQPPSYLPVLLVSHKPAMPILRIFYVADHDETGTRSSWIVTIRTY